jgi:transketolase
MEGISQEAASLAGHLHLGELICLYDQNHISLAGATEIDFTEDVAKRFEASEWDIRVVPDGNDTEEVARAIQKAQAEDRRPSLILARTHIGYGSPHKQDNFTAHGDPLGEDELQAAKKALGWPTMDKFCLLRSRWNISVKRFLRVRYWRTSGGRSSTRTSKSFRKSPPSSIC